MMIEPPPARRMAGTAYFTDRNTPSRLIAVCRRQSANDISMAGDLSDTPQRFRDGPAARVSVNAKRDHGFQQVIIRHATRFLEQLSGSAGYGTGIDQTETLAPSNFS